MDFFMIIFYGNSLIGILVAVIARYMVGSLWSGSTAGFGLSHHDQFVLTDAVILTGANYLKWIPIHYEHSRQ